MRLSDTYRASMRNVAREINSVLFEYWARQKRTRVVERLLRELRPAPLARA